MARPLGLGKESSSRLIGSDGQRGGEEFVGNPNRNLYWRFPQTRTVSLINAERRSITAGDRGEGHRIDRDESVDGIVLRSSEDARPGPKEILMRVYASWLNYRDLMVLKGAVAVRQSSASCR